MILQLKKLAQTINCAREINVLSDTGSSSLTAVFLQEFTGEFGENEPREREPPGKRGRF